MDEPSNLLLLLVDDDRHAHESLREVLRPFGIEPFAYPRVDPYSKWSAAGIVSWAQTVGALHPDLRADAPPSKHDWDVLVADIRFDQDREQDVPSYPGTDSMGMLLAMALVARRNASVIPYGWVLRSADGRAVAADPVAIRTYALLHALVGRAPGLTAPEGRWRPARLVETARTLLSSIPATTVHDGWRPAITSLRSAILDAARCRAVRAEWVNGGGEAFLRAAATNPEARAKLHGPGARAKLHGPGLRLTAVSPRSVRVIKVLPLFADIWDTDGKRLLDESLATRWVQDLNVLMPPCSSEDILASYRGWQAKVDLAMSSDGYTLAGVVTLRYLELLYDPAEAGTAAVTGRESWGQRQWVRALWHWLGNPPQGKPDYKKILGKLQSASGMSLEDMVSGLRSGRWPSDHLPVITAAGRQLLRELEWPVERELPTCIGDRIS